MRKALKITSRHEKAGAVNGCFLRLWRQNAVSEGRQGVSVSVVKATQTLDERDVALVFPSRAVSLRLRLISKKHRLAEPTDSMISGSSILNLWCFGEVRLRRSSFEP